MILEFNEAGCRMAARLFSCPVSLTATTALMLETVTASRLRSGIFQT
jgi:hypothetical protein